MNILNAINYANKQLKEKGIKTYELDTQILMSKAIKKQKIPINPAIVISNKSNAKGLAIAKKMGVQTAVIDSSKYKGRRLQFDKEIISTLRN